MWSDLLGFSSQSESWSLYTSHPSHLSILIPQPSQRGLRKGRGGPIHCQTPGLPPGQAGIWNVCCVFEMIPSEGLGKDPSFPSSDAIERGISWGGLVVQLPLPPTRPPPLNFRGTVNLLTRLGLPHKTKLTSAPCFEHFLS